VWRTRWADATGPGAHLPGDEHDVDALLERARGAACAVAVLVERLVLGLEPREATNLLLLHQLHLRPPRRAVSAPPRNRPAAAPRPHCCGHAGQPRSRYLADHSHAPPPSRPTVAPTDSPTVVTWQTIVTLGTSMPLATASVAISTRARLFCEVPSAARRCATHYPELGRRRGGRACV